MSACLFNIYINYVMREMKGKKMNDTDLVSVFDTVCRRRKVTVNVNKNKVMVCEQSGSKVVGFVCPYGMGIE